MKDHYEKFRQLGCDVVGVSFAPPAVVAGFLDEMPMPFPVVSDPSRTAYQALGLGRTSWGTILRFGVIGRYLKLILRGWRPRKPRKNEDLLQLGGDFLLDAQHRLVHAYLSAEPTDRPSIDQLLQVVRATTKETLR